MDASLCLGMPQAAAKMTPELLYGRNPTSIRHHHHLYSGFVACTTSSSTSLNLGLITTLDSRRVGLSIRASGLPSPSADDKTRSGHNETKKIWGWAFWANPHPRADDKTMGGHNMMKKLWGWAVGGAVLLLCLTGIERCKLGFGAPVPLTWRPPFFVQSAIWSPPIQFEKDATSLLDLFDLLDLLREARSLMKDKPGTIKFKNEAAESIELIRQWKEKKGPKEIYELGLSLIEILINRREYNKASEVLQKLSPPTPIDGRLPLRKFIIDLSVQLRSMRDSRWRHWRQIVDTEKHKWEEYNQKYKFSLHPPS